MEIKMMMMMKGSIAQLKVLQWHIPEGNEVIFKKIQLG
jgi:hypothetical protein